MASLSDTISSKLILNKNLINYLLFNILGKMADVPTIIQLTNLFNILLKLTSNDLKQIFIDYIKLDLMRTIEKLYFILENSLNFNLLDNTCLLIFIYFY